MKNKVTYTEEELCVLVDLLIMDLEKERKKCYETEGYDSLSHAFVVGYKEGLNNLFTMLRGK